MIKTTIARTIDRIASMIILAIIVSVYYLSLPVVSHGTITTGEQNTSIIAQLSQKGYALSVIDEWLMHKLFPPLKKGEVRLGKKRFERIDFLYRLTQAKPPLIKLTLIPGETKYFFFKQIARKLDVNESKLHLFYDKHARYREAAILADTYLAPKKMDEEALILFLLKSSQRRYKALSTSHFGDYNTTRWNTILTIASIIQKEAANKQEMPLIASVIKNRIEKKMRLQMDGTLNYGRYSHTKVTPQRIRTDTSAFNTYKHKGLPPSPIGSVSLAAIKAALNPAQTSYLYFVLDRKSGTHRFSETFKEHRDNIKKTPSLTQSVNQPDKKRGHDRRRDNHKQ